MECWEWSDEERRYLHKDNGKKPRKLDDYEYCEEDEDGNMECWEWSDEERRYLHKDNGKKPRKLEEYCEEDEDGNEWCVSWDERRKLHEEVRKLSAMKHRNLEGGCPEGQVNDLGLCYDKCDEGWHGFLCNCARDDNILDTYWRGCGTIPGRN